MPWCPECGTEYREGFTVCTDCRVPLTDTPPEKKEQQPDPELVRETLLTVVKDELEFTRIESLMAEAGIPVLKKHRGSGEYLELYMGATPYGLEIYVPYEALSRAKALLSGDESVIEEMQEGSQPVQEPVLPDESEKSGPFTLNAAEERELAHYMNAVNTDMMRRKKSIATVMLLSMGAGIIWTVYSILREFF